MLAFDVLVEGGAELAPGDAVRGHREREGMLLRGKDREFCYAFRLDVLRRSGRTPSEGQVWSTARNLLIASPGCAALRFVSRLSFLRSSLRAFLLRFAHPSLPEPLLRRSFSLHDWHLRGNASRVP